MRRKRKHIPLRERYAAALSMLLDQPRRDELRAARVSAETVIRLFTDDHGSLHALGGSDKWWNLTPRLRGPELKAKDRKDTGIVAKVRRNEEAWSAFTRSMSSKRPGRGVKKPKSKWPKRKVAWARRPLR